MNHVYIMRGVPGSGKSTMAKSIALSAVIGESIICMMSHWIGGEGSPLRLKAGPVDGDSPILASIHSTDNYFMFNGEYRFNPRFIGSNHTKNKKAFHQDLVDEVPVVICDNTNVKHKEFKPYLMQAQANGYLVGIVTMPHPTIEQAVERNTHNVPQEVIKRMLLRWQA